MTSFPPPPGFGGYQKGDPGSFGYERECSAVEAAILQADANAANAAERAEDEALREQYFETLRAEQEQ